MGLATLTLLASLFVAVQGYLDPPEQALAACQPETGCGAYYWYPVYQWCCEDHWQWRVPMYIARDCYRIDLNCDVIYWTETLGWFCGGPFCGQA